MARAEDRGPVEAVLTALRELPATATNADIARQLGRTPNAHGQHTSISTALRTLRREGRVRVAYLPGRRIEVVEANTTIG